MHRPARWLSGFIPLLLLLFAALGTKLPEIRADIATRTGAAVAPYGLGVEAIVSGRDVRLEGASFSEEGRAKAIEAAQGTPGVRKVTDDTSVIALRSPYTFEARREGGAIVLKGYTPNPDVRKALAGEAARLGTVSDQSVFARGAAPSFQAWATASVAALASLSPGEARLVDNALSISGDAPDQASYARTLAALKTPPPGLSISKAEIRPPLMSPYLWSVASDGRTTTIEGAAPGEDARAALLAAARSAFVNPNVVDRMQISRGAGEGFAGWTRAALGALARLGKGRASLSDATLTISGEANDFAAYNSALAALKQLPAGLKLAQADIAPPAVSPFTWSARSDGKTITLEGYVPSEEARAAILAAAKAAAPGFEIVDRMQVARGAPADFLARATGVLKALAQLGSGEAKLSDGALSFAGQMKAGQTAEDFARSAQGFLPPGLTIPMAGLRAPEHHPYIFQAKKGVDGAIVISGYAPSEALLQAAMASARTAGTSVFGGATLATGLPADVDFGVSTALGFFALGALRNGELILEEDGLTIRGAADEMGALRIRTALAGLAAGVRIKLADIIASNGSTAAPSPANPAVPAPRRPLNPVEQACQQKLLEQVASRNVQFATGSAEIEKESQGLIDSLANVLKSCPDVKVEVGGHTDNSGDPDMNKRLSLSRARAVVDALASAGVAAERLSAAGYGEERPIATNDTAEGRAQNRRTEFVVQ